MRGRMTQLIFTQWAPFANSWKYSGKRMLHGERIYVDLYRIEYLLMNNLIYTNLKLENLQKGNKLN